MQLVSLQNQAGGCRQLVLTPKILPQPARSAREAALVLSRKLRLCCGALHAAAGPAPCASGGAPLYPRRSHRVLCRASAGDASWRPEQPLASPAGQQKATLARPASASSGNGVFLLLLLNVVLFTLDHYARQGWVQGLYLFNARPRWWQFITSAFCHANFEHLSGNMFMLYVFGRIVEEEEGFGGVWSTYIFCALGASIATLLLQAKTAVSLGASGAVFGMFTMGVLCKFRLSFKKLLECAILGQFVIKQVMQEVQAQAAKSSGWGAAQVAGVQVGHIAHIAGALAGVLLVLVLSRIPVPSAEPA